MGGVKYESYNSLTREIWKWAENRHIYLHASYIASSDNVEADRLSRIKNQDTKWELNYKYFEKILNVFGTPNIDLFATRYNTKCKKFFSWAPDRAATQVDAFTVNWNKLNFYAFPPFCLILQILIKIKREKATGIIVIPDWPNQPWYPLYLDLVIGKPIKFTGIKYTHRRNT